MGNSGVLRSAGYSFVLPAQGRALTFKRQQSMPGLFVPKPSRGAGCQGSGLPDLGTTARQRPLASTAGRGDCYSLGYSAQAGIGRISGFQDP